MMPPRSRNCSGFTLLELLIAMVLLAAIVGLVVSSMRIGFRSIDAGDRMVASLERMRASLQVVESHLRSAMKVRPAKDAQAGEKLVQFTGESGTMAFKSLHSLWGGTKGPVAVTYRVTDEGNGRKSLRLTESPVVIEVPREALLFHNVEAIGFEFFKKGATDETGAWVEQWEDTERFPERVRMTVKKDQRTIALVIGVPVAEKDPKVAAGGPLGP